MTGQKRNRQRLLVDMIDGGEDRVPIRVVVRKRPLTSNERGRGAYKPDGHSHASLNRVHSIIGVVRRAAEGVSRKRGPIDLLIGHKRAFVLTYPVYLRWLYRRCGYYRDRRPKPRGGHGAQDQGEPSYTRLSKLYLEYWACQVFVLCLEHTRNRAAVPDVIKLTFCVLAFRWT